MKQTFFIGSILLAVSALFYSFHMLQQHNITSYQQPVSNDLKPFDKTTDQKKAKQKINYQSFIEATPSLKGTSVDGEFQFDKDGNLIITKEVRYIFEYFFSSLGEQNPDNIRQALSNYAQTQLTGAEQDKVMDLYDNYLKARAMDSEQSFSGQPAGTDKEGLKVLQQHQAELKQHRRQFLSNEYAELFYAEEEAYDEYSINRLLITQNSSLSVSEKQLALDTLEENLPESQKDIRNAINQSKELDKTLAQLRDKEASEDEIYHARTQTLGHDKAERLRQYEAEMARWNSRYKQHLNQQRYIIESEGLSDTDKKMQIEQRLKQNFSIKEIKEIKRMEAVELAKLG